MSIQTGQVLDGKYRIIRELGSGAMGAVYEGENVRIHRRVAIKVLLPAVAQNTNAVQRFEREAQAAGRIGSEHIVEVLDLGTLADGGFYMVMEFLEGQTLGERIRSRGRLTPREMVPVAQQLLSGLEMAHDARIIHRDLKPDNVFLMRDYAGQRDFVKILDFGVSKFNPLNIEEGMSMTRTGAVVGTPFYMAPEQAKGAREIDQRSDIYSVGVILYEAVTGQKPFHAGTFNELIFKIVLEAPPPPEVYVPNLDPAFARIVRRAMAREPGDRFKSASEFRETLSLWLHTGRDSTDAQPAPPPLTALDWDDDKPTAVASNPERSGTVMMEDGRAAIGTHLMDEPYAAMRTHLMDDPDAAMRTRLMDEPDMATRTVDSSAPRIPSAPPSRRKPPPSRRHRTEPMPEVGGVSSAAHFQAALAPHAAAPLVVLPAPPAVPHFAQPHGYARLDGALHPTAPTPVPPAHDSEPWPIAGVPRPRRKGGMLPVVAGVVLAVGVGATAGIVLLRPRAELETSQQSQEEPAAAAEANDSSTAIPRTEEAKSDQASSDTAPAGSASSEPDPEPLVARAVAPAPGSRQTPAPGPRRPPSPASQRPRPPVSRPVAAAPSPKPASTSSDSGSGGSKKIKTGGRTINTEL